MASTSIDSFPGELLREIFAWADNGTTHDGNPRDTMSRVCTRWDDIIEHYPRLWSRVVLDCRHSGNAQQDPPKSMEPIDGYDHEQGVHESQVEPVRKAIQLSGACELDVTILTTTGSTFGYHVSRLINLIFGASHRWRSLSIICDGPELSSFFDRHPYLPVLRCLRVYVYFPETINVPTNQPPASIIAPNLAQFDTNVLQPPGIPFGQIQQFVGSFASKDQCWQVLRQLRSVKMLGILSDAGAEWSRSPPPAALVLPTVKTLLVSRWAFGPAFGCLVFPQLRVLQIGRDLCHCRLRVPSPAWDLHGQRPRYGPGGPTHQFLSMLSQSSPFTELKIFDNVGPHLMRSLLRLCHPTLEKLYIESLISFFNFVHHAKVAPNGYPRLQELQVMDHDGVHSCASYPTPHIEDEIVQVIQATADFIEWWMEWHRARAQTLPMGDIPQFPIETLIGAVVEHGQNFVVVKYALHCPCFNAKVATRSAVLGNGWSRMKKDFADYIGSVISMKDIGDEFILPDHLIEKRRNEFWASTAVSSNYANRFTNDCQCAHTPWVDGKPAFKLPDGQYCLELPAVGMPWAQLRQDPIVSQLMQLE
ncbi:hypothetical protein CYLTODRAFT_495053 [Cylindrobasidium torrendii FP15055 ss-10]|uniref:F-box domain-containing protein n=1 Tax=Cylindrobasidium torrendii FP15055 ss-10 TaxID=1314674 RepID=A0A0D7ATU7_9AGAR|nr:hypothetical protein CYLTODRAFT_495053 [Cylindrobasidium torrendii FP15055 ss-10]